MHLADWASPGCCSVLRWRSRKHQEALVAPKLVRGCFLYGQFLQIIPLFSSHLRRLFWSLRSTEEEGREKEVAQWAQRVRLSENLRSTATRSWSQHNPNPCSPVPLSSSHPLLASLFKKLWCPNSSPRNWSFHSLNYRETFVSRFSKARNRRQTTYLKPSTTKTLSLVLRGNFT